VLRWLGANRLQLAELASAKLEQVRTGRQTGASIALLLSGKQFHLPSRSPRLGVLFRQP